METIREDGLLMVGRCDAENIARTVYDAVHGTGKFDDLPYIARDAAIEAAYDKTNAMGLGFVPW